MKFPSQQLILSALQRWKARRHLHDIGDTHYDQYINACKERKVEPKKRTTYYSWLAPSHLNPIQFDDLMALIESLHDPDGPDIDVCVNADLFLDYCSVPTLRDIALAKKRVTVEANVESIQADAGSLKGNRTRLDVFKWPKDYSTIWGRHDGHEYLHLMEGVLECQFAETSLVAETERHKIILNEGDGIAFPSSLFHRFIAKADSELTVARPTWVDAAAKRQK